MYTGKRSYSESRRRDGQPVCEQAVPGPYTGQSMQAGKSLKKIMKDSGVNWIGQKPAVIMFQR